MILFLERIFKKKPKVVKFGFLKNPIFKLKSDLMARKIIKRSEEENRKIISEILEKHSFAILEIVETLRKILQGLDLGLEERGYPVWKAIGLRDKKSGYVCGIFPFSDKVQLIFEWGVLLKDKTKKLAGKSKQIRYLEYTSLGDVDSSVIREFVLQTLALPIGKKDKEFMIQSLNKASKPDKPEKKSHIKSKQ